MLALYARQWILAQDDLSTAGDRAAAFTSMTSNQFLSAFGDPTSMEAEIGTVYERDGLEAAFAFIETKFLPLYLRQRKKAQQPGSYRNR